MRSIEAPGADAVMALRRAGVEQGGLVALVMAPGVGAAVATETGITFSLNPAEPSATDRSGSDPCPVVGRIDAVLGPRWVMWSKDTAALLVEADVRVARSWDIAAVHRLLFGGWRADPARVWALLHHLRPPAAPTSRPPDLFSQAEPSGGDPDDPVEPQGQLRSDWVSGEWSSTPARLGRWAELALTVAHLQRGRLDEMLDRPHALSVARSESAAELLCTELAVDGLPMDRAVAEAVVARFVGSRPHGRQEIDAERARRDAEVLRHVPASDGVDLRSPGQVRSLLARAGLEVSDTRAWRLRALRDAHPVVGALLAWRKAERVATTYGYGWLDANLSPDGRSRGSWTGCDGAAGRMTASAGLHNMPAEMREAVMAEPGHVFVRADLGQIEPRVLAAVSADHRLAQASAADDMYAPVAAELDVDRATAKVAVLGAMYGQTTGRGAQALRGLKSSYPVAMAYLEAADRAGREGRDLRTYGGRLISMGATGPTDMVSGDPANRAARGRYGRNAVVPGAAAELFKLWAVTVRARTGDFGARIVLCLHDELLVHAPRPHGDAVADLLEACLGEAVRRWARDSPVRFVADISVVDRWSEAKAPAAG